MRGMGHVLRPTRRPRRSDPKRDERVASRNAQGWQRRRPLTYRELEPVNHGTSDPVKWVAR